MQSRSELRLWRARSSNKFQCVILAGAQQRVEGVRTRAMGSLGRVVSRMRFTENDFSLGPCRLWKIYSRLAWPPAFGYSLHLRNYMDGSTRETQVQR